MDRKYELIIADDTKHEETFIEIYMDNKFIALVCLEGEKDQVFIEWPASDVDEDKVVRKVELNEFIRKLKEAVRMLQRQNDNEAK
jgi:hypothetical protein